jgi:hypothetical protein
MEFRSRSGEHSALAMLGTGPSGIGPVPVGTQLPSSWVGQKIEPVP